MLFGRPTRIGSCVLSILILLLFSASFAFAQADPLQTRITTASGVRVRTAPQTAAEEVTRLPIGTILTPMERVGSKEKIGSVEEYWYRIKTPDSKEGWVFGGLTGPLQTGAEEAAYLKIARDRLQVQNPVFADMVDLFEFLTRVSNAATGAKKPELELDRLLALQKVLTAIPVQDHDQAKYKKWVKDHDSDVIYSEPGGQWMVKSVLFWDLQKKYARLPIGEQIAWAGAQNPLPGECEGFMDCELGYFNLTSGRYLNLYPSGAHAEEALSQLSEDITRMMEDLKQRSDALQVSDKSDFHKEMGLAKATIEKTNSPRKRKLIEDLNQIEARIK